MKTTAFEQIKMSLQRTKGYTASKISKLADTTVAAIEELDERKANAEEITQKIDTTIQNGTDIKNLIGQTENTGGTTSAGTVMAKLNKLLTDWTTTRAGYITNLNSRLTSTRAGYLDKLANFGATSDTGGTATAGTLMAKVNALLGSGGSAGLKVKSVQHGYVDKTYLSNATSRTITIKQVVAAKSILITNTSVDTYRGGSIVYTYGYAPILLDDGKQLQQNAYNNWFTQFNWSIIEFE